MMGFKTFQKVVFSSILAVFSVFLCAAELSAQSSGLNYDFNYENDASRYGSGGYLPPEAFGNGYGRERHRPIVEFNMNYNGDDVLGCSGLNLQDLVGFNLNMNDLPQRFGDYLKSSFTTELLARAMTHPLLANVFSEADAFGSFRADYLTQQCNASTVADRAQQIRRTQMMSACTEQHRGQYGNDQAAEARAITECINNPDRQLAAYEERRRRSPPMTLFSRLQRSSTGWMQCASGPLYPNAGQDCENAQYALIAMSRDISPDGQRTQEVVTTKDTQTIAMAVADSVKEDRGEILTDDEGAIESGIGDAVRTAGTVLGSFSRKVGETVVRSAKQYRRMIRSGEIEVDSAEAVKYQHMPSNRMLTALQPSADPFLADVKMNVMGFAQPSGGSSDYAAASEAVSGMVLNPEHPFVRFIGCSQPGYTVEFGLFYQSLLMAIQDINASAGTPLTGEDSVEEQLVAVLDRLNAFRDLEPDEIPQVQGLMQPTADGYQTSTYQKLVRYGIPEMARMIVTGVGCVFNDRMGLDPALFWDMELAGVPDSEVEAIWAAGINELSFRVTELILRFMKHQMLNIYAGMAYDIATMDDDYSIEAANGVGGRSESCQRKQYENSEAVANGEAPPHGADFSYDECMNGDESEDEMDIESMEFMLEAVKFNADMFDNQIAALRVAHEARVDFAKVLNAVSRSMSQIQQSIQQQ